MAEISWELLKSSVKLWFALYVLLLILFNGTPTIYLTIILVPIVYIAMNKYALPPAEEWIADEILGAPVTVHPAAGSCPPTLIISHRTSAFDAPENTLAGIRKAKLDGATAVEMDVRFTKDNVAVLMHDERVDRTTDGAGCLADLTYLQIRNLDASAKHIYHTKYKHEPIPTLEEAIQECIHLNMKMFIEMKDVDERAINLLLEFYQKYPVLYEMSAIVSFYPYFLYQVRQKDAHVVTVLVWRPYVLSFETPTGLMEDGSPRQKGRIQQIIARVLDEVFAWAVHHVLWYLCGVNGMFIHKAVICPHYISHWARVGMRVIVWTVNAPREKDYLSNVLQLNYMSDSILKNPVPSSAPKTRTPRRKAVDECEE